MTKRARVPGAMRSEVPLPRTGTVPNTGVRYGPGSAAHRFARATRCAASGARELRLLLDGVRLARARGEDGDRFLDRFDGAFGGARAMSDQIVGAVEVEPADLADPRRDQEVRRIAGGPRPGDAVLHDVEGIDHHRGDAGTSAAAKKFALHG